MQKIKLIVCDVDGTLVPHGKKETTEKNLRAIKKAQRAGVKFTLASGRAFQAMKRWIGPYNIDAPVACCNGADIRSADKAYYTSSFSRETFSEICSMLDEMGIQQYAASGFRMYCTEADANKKIYDIWLQGGMKAEDIIVMPSRQEIISAIGGDVQKVIGWGEDTASMKRMIREGEKIDGVQAVNTIFYDTEFLQKGVHKGSAIEKLAQIHGIKPENIMAIGDAENDIEMVSNAGIGIAMGNAGTKTKEAADHVVANCDQSGVAEAIERFVL